MGARRFMNAWRALPAVLAWGLLALQTAVPWTVAHYITQDGPSHLYTALVTKDLILHPHGLYASFYRLQPKLVTNWSTTLLLGLLAPIFGADHAEAALASLCVLAGFGCMTYFRRSIEPAAPVGDPLTNFLTNTWFLWVGFYNFYLGMAGCALLAGYYIRRSRGFGRKEAAMLGGGLVLLFFTHVLAAALAVMAVIFVAVWESARNLKPNWRVLLGSLAPVLIMATFFVRSGLGRLEFKPDVAWAWSSFPMQVFASARGRAAEEALLVPAMLCFMAAGLLALRYREWASVRLPLAAAAVASFAGYLFLPDIGFGGGAIKIRLAWAVFWFGCPAAFGTRMRALRTPLSIYIACFVAANLISTAGILRNVSRAAGVYASALEQVPEGSTVARIHYEMHAARERFGFDFIASDPLFHADAWMASRRRLVDLTDYQALTRVFPITLRKAFTGTQQNRLYQLEGGEANGFDPRVLEDLPAHPEYVVLVGDEGSEIVRMSDFEKTVKWLDANLAQVASTDFLRVYRWGKGP